MRLLESLTSPADAQVLGPQIMREITYRMLCCEHGNSLQALIALNRRLGQTQRALQRMHANYSQTLDIASLAADASMSASAFHHRFKAVTASGVCTRVTWAQIGARNVEKLATSSRPLTRPTR